MTLDELRTLFRQEADDLANPPLWSDEEVDRYLNDAENEACIRALLLEDETSQATQIDVNTTDRRYKLHKSVLHIKKLTAALHPLAEVTGWEATRTELVFDEAPLEADTLTALIVRLPLKPMAQDGDSPEIPEHMHAWLVEWALSRAFLKRDAETYDEAASAKHEAEFARYFGVRRTADVYRKQRRRSARVVRPIQF